MTKTELEKLKTAHDELMQIHIQANDSLHMANALIALEQAVQELEAEQKEAEDN